MVHFPHSMIGAPKQVFSYW